MSSPFLVPIVIGLSASEAEVITVGLENSRSLLVLDDQLGRRVAAMHRLRFAGTLGILICAKSQGLIP